MFVGFDKPSWQIYGFIHLFDFASTMLSPNGKIRSFVRVRVLPCEHGQQSG